MNLSTLTTTQSLFVCTVYTTAHANLCLLFWIILELFMYKAVYTMNAGLAMIVNQCR